MDGVENEKDFVTELPDDVVFGVGKKGRGGGVGVVSTKRSDSQERVESCVSEETSGGSQAVERSGTCVGTGTSGGVQASDLASDYTCSVCLELFTEPKVLPCCHTFCLKCLKKMATSGMTKGQVTCPKCRKSHQIPAGGLSALLTDFIAACEIKATGLNLQNAPNTQVCGECGQSGPISHFCSNCQYICRVCGLELHKRLKTYEGHKVYPIAEVDAATLQSCQVHYCPLHKGEVLNLYCENCEELICRDCTLVKHRQHNYKFVKEAREQVGGMMMTLKSDVEKKFLILKNNLQEIKKVEATTVAHPKALKAKINSFFDDLVHSIEARRTTLLQQAEGACQKDLKQVWADKEYHEVEIGHISAVFSLVDKAVKCTSDSEMILTALQSITQLRIIKEREWDGCAFSNAVLSTPQFSSGRKLALASVGDVSCAIIQKTLQVSNQRSSVDLNTYYIFEVYDNQPLVNGRSGAIIVSLQPTTLNVTVQYGSQYQKKLDDANITVTSITQQRSSMERKYRTQYNVNIKPVCGGRHTVTIKSSVCTASHHFTVSGKPRNGARMRKGPDWENKDSETRTDTDFLGTVCYSNDPYHGSHHASWLVARNQSMIPIKITNGQICHYRWGNDWKYEVELA